MKIVQPSKQLLHSEEDNKRTASVATILQWELPFCIAPSSVDLFGWAVENGLVLDFDIDGG